MAAPAVVPGTPAPAGVLWHSAAFVEALARLAPLQVAAAARARLETWAQLSAEV